MNILFRFLSGMLLILPLNFITANEAPYTIHPATNQDCDDDSNTECQEVTEKRARSILHHHRYNEMEEKEDPTYELEDDTAWPSEREDYSDTLFR